MEVLPAKLLIWDLVPHTPAVITDLHALWPPTSTVRPAGELDRAIVDDDVVVDRCHDSGRHRHGLNAEAVAVGHILLAELRCVIEVFLHLDWGHRRVGDDVDAGEPFAAARADVAHHHHTQGRTVDGGKRFPVHFPGEQDFIDLHFAKWHRNGVIIYLSLLEVRVCAKELDVRARGIFQPAAVFEDFLEGDSSPASGANCAFTPGRVDEFIAITRVLVDLLDAPGARALKGDDGGLAGEYRFVFQKVKGDVLRFVD